MNLDDELRTKTTANGPFEDVAQLAQGIKFALRRGRNWEPMSPESKEALEQIASRLAMILTGDPNEAKHWNRIAMYARIRDKALEQTSLESGVTRLARLRARDMPLALPEDPTDETR
jgi:hypothetical protein